MSSDSSYNDKKWIKYGKLLSGLIHNLNTPLMGLSGRVELLQMKFDDEKSFKQINTQLDRINNMLTAVAYLLDKEHTEKESVFDLETFINNFCIFMGTDMRYKHGTDKDVNISPCKVSVVPQACIFILYSCLDFLLNYINDESNIQILNKIESKKTVITVSLIFENNHTVQKIAETFLLETFDNNFIEKYLISYMTEEDKISFEFSLNIVND